MDLTTVLVAFAAALLASLVVGLICAKAAKSARKETDFSKDLDAAKRELLTSQQTGMQTMVGTLTLSQKEVFAGQDKHIADLRQSVENFTQQQEAQSASLRKNLFDQMTVMREENEKKLSEIRGVVDEKLQKTLEDKLSSSFKQVSERLEAVYKGLGEMQSLASGVGDLKKVLMNVKTRGNFGEYQLGAILEQILSPEQYEENVATVPGSANRVEYAVKLPGKEDGKSVYLPIDSKFPMDAYSNLCDARDTGDEGVIHAAEKELEARIKSFAKDVSDKYIDPPNTTDFAILFLPTEGLYAEVVRRDLLSELQAKYKVNVAGPTTMAALLNSLQMGFKTLAIQKRSSEVWEVLGAVRTEFERFEDVLNATQSRLNQANKELDKLVGVRTRAINAKLRKVATLPQSDAEKLLSEETAEAEGAFFGENGDE